MVSFVPPQVDERESLDDPAISFDVRRKMLLELDSSNTRLGVYKRFVGELESRIFSEARVRGLNKLSILEIGSGSGGLAREILPRNDSGVQINYSLMDIDPAVLAWSQDRLRAEGIKVAVHPSTDKHLGQFGEREFDLIISLHVLHHIQPIAALREMFAQAARVARLGFFMADLERRWGMCMTANLVNFYLGSSPEMRRDGLRSVRRAWTASEVLSCAVSPENSAMSNFEVSQHRIVLYPYQLIWGLRRRPTPT